MIFNQIADHVKPDHAYRMRGSMSSSSVASLAFGRGSSYRPSGEIGAASGEIGPVLSSRRELGAGLGGGPLLLVVDDGRRFGLGRGAQGPGRLNLCFPSLHMR